MGVLCKQQKFLGYQFVFNNGLTKNNKFHILAAAISWPSHKEDSDYGIVFLSKFGREG